jgi:predicted phage terminase large subunit-like protein
MHDLIESDWYRDTFKIQWKIRPDIDAKGKFANTLGGIRQSKGLNATITGDRADAIIVDDPNDVKDAFSDTKIKSVNQRFDSGTRNRVNDYERSFRILIQQRVHEGDLTGHLLSKGAYRHLAIPMEAGQCKCKCSDCKSGESFLGWRDPRPEYESIHKGRFSLKVIEEEKSGLGPLQWPGQLNQTPTAAGGGYFKPKWWSWFRPEGKARFGNCERPDGANDMPAEPKPQADWAVISVDADFKNTKDMGSQACVGVVSGDAGAKRWVEWVGVGQGILETISLIEEAVTKAPTGSAVLIEDKANGSAIIEMLSGKIAGVIPIQPEGGKEARAAAIVPTCKAGDVHLPDGADWVEDFVSELASFPLGNRDDRVDMLSQALVEMQEGSDLWHARMISKL